MDNAQEKTVSPTSEDERRARVFETEVYPLVGERLAELLFRGDQGPWDGEVLQVGCGLGSSLLSGMHLRSAVGRVTIVESSEGILSRVRAKVPVDFQSGRVRFQVATLRDPLPFPSAEFDEVVANVSLSDSPDPGRVLVELMRVLKPGGRLHLATTLEGTWREFLDVYSDVLHRLRYQSMIESLLAYAQTLPDPELLACQLETLGLFELSVETSRFELVFRSAREFFYSPVIELGPLPRWKAVAGKGATMQDVLFAVKEAIDVYFGDRPFSVGIYAGRFVGRKRGE